MIKKLYEALVEKTNASEPKATPFEIAQAESREADIESTVLSRAINTFPKSSMGLVTEEAQKLDTYKEIKSLLSTSMNKLKSINKTISSDFKKELKASRKDRMERMVEIKKNKEEADRRYNERYSDLNKNSNDFDFLTSLEEEKSKFKYGMNNRPPSMGALPDGYVIIEKHNYKARHGVVGYAEKLTDDQLNSFEMTDLSEEHIQEVAKKVVLKMGKYSKAYLENQEGLEDITRQVVFSEYANRVDDSRMPQLYTEVKTLIEKTQDKIQSNEPPKGYVRGQNLVNDGTVYTKLFRLASAKEVIEKENFGKVSIFSKEGDYYAFFHKLNTYVQAGTVKDKSLKDKSLEQVITAVHNVKVSLVEEWAKTIEEADAPFENIVSKDTVSKIKKLTTKLHFKIQDRTSTVMKIVDGIVTIT
ncbi:MAG: hypothetical protein GQ474_10555, partial [Sulfurimonas sp.]|nr:hypothetical protein [Sulfurimonas sp.]